MTEPQSLSPLTIAVTGATGFVGTALVPALRAAGHNIVALSRGNGFVLEKPQGFADRLTGVDVLVHCAARVHQLHDKGDQLALYRRINADATVQLARASVSAGVGRFVFLSTAKVYGEGCAQHYSESTAPAPLGAYAQTKYEAEQHLQALAGGGALELVILRPPLVYGAGVGGNFDLLWRLANSRWPLPLAAVNNRRDMVALENLVDVLVRCCVDRAAAGCIFNIADREPYSLADILATLRVAGGREAGLWSLPVPLLRLLLMLMRGRADVQRLLGDFRLDTQKLRETLRWEPHANIASVAAQCEIAMC